VSSQKFSTHLDSNKNHLSVKSLKIRLAKSGLFCNQLNTILAHYGQAARLSQGWQEHLFIGHDQGVHLLSEGAAMLPHVNLLP